MVNLNGEACPSKIRGVAITVIFIVLFAFVVRAYISMQKPVKAERESFRLGTIVKLTAYGSNSAELNKALNHSMEDISSLESLFSVNIVSSDVSRINQVAGKQVVAVNIETGELIKRAVHWSKFSNGAFDPTIGRLVKLWGIGTNVARVPTDNAINDALESVNYKLVNVMSSKGNLLVSIGVGQSLDLGGIAKGWIADRIASVLKERGVTSALIDLGGNIVVLGKSPKGQKWKLGLQHPYKPRGEYFAVVDAEDISVVTSGSYERFFEKDGVRYHHILDPATGAPANSDLVSVTVVNKSSADADALCTALFVMGFDKSAVFLREHKNIQAALVVKEGEKTKVIVTSGLKDDLTLKDETMAYEVFKGVLQ